MLPYPNPEPVRFATMYQSWCDITFLHWRFPVDDLAARIPAPLTPDTFDGSAWVGVTPFMLKGLRMPFMPPLPWISRFPETNCRTYVRAPDGASGVWFFSLDAARGLAVAGARIGYGLPYAWSKMAVQRAGARFRYRSTRKWPTDSGTTDIEIECGNPIEARDLEIFLTARFRLFSFLGSRLIYANVEHPPWPLREARVVRLEQTLIAAAGLRNPNEPPIAHFSPGVRVRVGGPQPLEW